MGLWDQFKVNMAELSGPVDFAIAAVMTMVVLITLGGIIGGLCYFIKEEPFFVSGLLGVFSVLYGLGAVFELVGWCCSMHAIDIHDTWAHMHDK